MKFGWNPPGRELMRSFARSIGLPRAAGALGQTADPYFGNAVGVLLLDGRFAHVTVEGTRPDKTLGEVASLELT